MAGDRTVREADEGPQLLLEEEPQERVVLSNVEGLLRCSGVREGQTVGPL